MKILDMKRQGECLFIHVDEFPDDGPHDVIPAQGGRLIVGHSETGHHHVIDLDCSPNAQLLINKENQLMGRLIVGDEPTEVKHLRDHDTHKPVFLEKGNHIVRWRREHTPEGFRRVID